MDQPADITSRIIENISKVIIGKKQQIQDVLSCWMAGGHILLEDVPGTGKTILARAVARSCTTVFRRVQFAPDLLPSDILGASVFRQDNQSFEFHPGPIFTVVFLADEINRATPRTQSALLEAMSEGQVSIDGKTYKLDPLFFSMATQNPVEQLGTFQLPEAQLDRFMMKISMGYPDPAEEIRMLKEFNLGHPIDSLQPVETHERLKWVKDRVKEISVSDEVYAYINEIIAKTRKSSNIRVGASPRASLALARCSQAAALIEGFDFVSPGQVYRLIKPVLSHRLVLTADAKIEGQTADQILDQIISETPTPIRRQG